MHERGEGPDDEHGRGEWWVRLVLLTIIAVPIVVTVLVRTLGEPGAMDCSTFGMSC